jgi:hypothetical protein
MTKLIILLPLLLLFTPEKETHQIEKIEFSTNRCFGKCPIFSLVVNEDRSATFNAIQHNDKSGKFKGQLGALEFSLLLKLLENADFTNLKERYSVLRTDHQTGFLTITYDNGKVKKVQDYGLSGTDELVKLYNFLFTLRKTQVWVPVE